MTVTCDYCSAACKKISEVSGCYSCDEVMCCSCLLSCGNCSECVCSGCAYGCSRCEENICSECHTSCEECEAVLCDEDCGVTVIENRAKKLYCSDCVVIESHKRVKKSESIPSAPHIESDKPSSGSNPVAVSEPDQEPGEQAAASQEPGEGPDLGSLRKRKAQRA